MESTTLAAVTVLYNPNRKVYDTINSYVNQLRLLIVVDNSEIYNDEIVDRLKRLNNVRYISNNGNKGIASALNTGARIAQDEGYKFLLSMDQDTELTSDFVKKMLFELSECTLKNIGIIAPSYSSGKGNSRWDSVMLVMTSGSIVDLNAYKKAGQFLDKLFIDHVDNEFCLRLISLGYKVVRANNIVILHRPGYVISKSILGIKVTYSSHGPKRLYYFCRNGFYVSELYSKKNRIFKRIFHISMLKELIKIPFETEKADRIKMIIKGFRDYKNEKFGQIEI